MLQAGNKKVKEFKFFISITTEFKRKAFNTFSAPVPKVKILTVYSKLYDFLYCFAHINKKYTVNIHLV